jgi:LPXTG-motif cell wall-anchored protein
MAKLNIKKLSADFLLVCGMVSALCTAFVQIKDTFFKEERVTKNESAIITQTIQGLPPGSHVSKTLDVQLAEEQPIAQSFAPEETNYIWIIILGVSLVGATTGFVLRKKILREVKEHV